MDEQEKKKILNNFTDYLKQLDCLEEQLNDLDPMLDEARDLRYNKDSRLSEVKREINDTLMHIKNAILSIKDGFIQYLDNQDEDVSNEAKQVQTRHKEVFSIFRDKDYQSLMI